MRPPICAICDSRDGVELVGFRRTVEDQAWHDRMAATGGVGHPPDVEWFCGQHLSGAEGLSTSTRADALRRLTMPSLETVPCGPIQAGTLFGLLVDLMPDAVRALGGVPPELSERSRRDWTPMDGAVAPNCPFVDERVVEGSGRGAEVRVSFANAQYSEESHSNTHVSCHVSVDGRRLFIAAGAHAESNRPVPLRELSVNPDRPAATGEIIQVLVGRIGGTD